jgi:guanylate kinase
MSKKIDPLLILISAPSGAGKTCTTREPRKCESDGVDYYFLKAEDFLRRVQSGNFLEHATVYGNSYGLLKSELLGKLRAGKDVLLNVDVQGAATIRAAALAEEELKRALVTVFLTTPSLEVLEARLKHRNADDPAVIKKRLAAAKQEVAQWKNFDYLVVSTSKAEDLRRTLAIVESEKMRVARSAAPEMEYVTLELPAKTGREKNRDGGLPRKKMPE